MEKTPLLVGLRAARTNLVPGLIVQSIMLALVLAYYHHEPTRELLGRLAQCKQHYGYLFAFVATGFAGGVLPEILRIVLFQRGEIKRANGQELLFAFPFWGLMGCCVDTLYRLQAFWFGTEVTVGVLAKKVAVDMLIYTPLWGTPAIVWAYNWKEDGFALNALGGLFTLAYYRFTIFPALLAGWGVWIPAVTVIYSLPTLLQVPLFTLATCFWSLLVAYIASEKSAA